MSDPLIRERIKRIQCEIRNVTSLDDSFYNARLEDYYNQLVALENINVQRDLVIAQQEVVEAQKHATAAQLADTAQHNLVRGRSDEQLYWSRRFLTSLTVAHGVGFVTCLTALTRQPPPELSVTRALCVIGAFAVGLMLMGALPIVMSRIDPTHADPAKDAGRTKAANIFGLVGTILLLLGLVGVGIAAFDTFKANKAAQVQAQQASPAPTQLPHLSKTAQPSP